MDPIIAQSITTVIMTKFKLPIMMYSPINTVLSKISFDYLPKDIYFSYSIFENIETLLVDYSIIITSILFLAIMYYAYYKYSMYDITYMVVNEKYVKILTKYIIKHPEYFYKYNGLIIGGVNYYKNMIPRELDDNISFDNNSKIYFHDTKYDIKGHIVYKTLNHTFNNGKNDVINKYSSCIMYSVNDKNKMYEYLQNINREIVSNNNDAKKYIIIKYDASKEKFVNHINKLPVNNHLLEKREEEYIHTFFHPQINKVWKKIKTIQYNPDYYIERGQTPYLNILAHGPPGTGKSSFAYRVARTLDRHIININVNTINDKNTFLQVMMRPYIDSHYLEPKDVIYIFDEFDLAIKNLSEKSKKNTTYGESASINVKDSNSSESEENQLTVHDLLEVFQGTIPLYQSIIIATTNNYDYIKETCPALVRPGRLTPILFDNTGSETINMIVKKYFNRDFTHTITKDYPVSYVIDKALECSIYYENIDEAYNEFLKEIL
jgi:DNA polymerase III delta prime subunit